METKVYSKLQRLCDTADVYVQNVNARDEFETKLLKIREDLIYEIEANMLIGTPANKEAYLNSVKGYAEFVGTDVVKQFEDNTPNFYKESYQIYQDIQDSLKFFGDSIISFCDKNFKNIKLMKDDEDIDPLQFDNLSQKLLLLESLGVLKAISETADTQISSRKMGRIISDLLGVKDATRHLRYFNPNSQPNDKNNPRNEKNLTVLHANLVKLKLPTLESLVEKQLKEAMNKED